MKLKGCLDAVTSSGFAEGWAFDQERPLRSLRISILREDTCIGEAVANSFRKDLGDAGFGEGWCAFRARLSISPTIAYASPLVLVDQASGRVIHKPTSLTFHEDSDPEIHSVSQLVDLDPTVINTLDKLRSCHNTFNAFVKYRGIEAFVRAAYVFMLSRPADNEGVINYTRLIRQSMLEPLELLLILAESDEYRRVPRKLGAPNTAAFPFHID